MYDSRDPGPGWQANLGANALGCESRPLRDWVLDEVNAVRRLDSKPPVTTRSLAYRTCLQVVIEYAQTALGTRKLDASKVIEPVFARVLIKLALSPAVAA